VNSVEALDYALSACHDRLRRLSNADSIRTANEAMDTLEALRDMIAVRRLQSPTAEPTFMKHLPTEVQTEIREWKS